MFGCLGGPLTVTTCLWDAVPMLGSIGTNFCARTAPIFSGSLRMLISGVCGVRDVAGTSRFLRLELSVPIRTSPVLEVGAVIVLLVVVILSFDVAEVIGTRSVRF